MALTQTKKTPGMFGRRWFVPIVLAAVAIPYALTSTGVSEKLSGLVAKKDEVSPAGAAKPGVANSDPSTADTTPAVVPPEGSAARDFHDIFRFDVTTAWVLAQWPRVSTRLADLEMQGYRAPLVTGTREDDLAGSLTYYFNPQQRVQRITFFGTTGDSRRLVAMLSQKHQFVRQLTDDPSLFLYRVRQGNKVTSELRIRPAKVVNATSPHARFEVALLIERPRSMD